MDIDIAQVARLARLALSDEEARRFEGQLGELLDYVAQLDELDTSEIPPTTHVLPVTTPLRADVVGEHLDRDEVLAQAPAHDGQAFAVPQVL